MERTNNKSSFLIIDTFWHMNHGEKMPIFCNWTLNQYLDTCPWGDLSQKKKKKNSQIGQSLQHLDAWKMKD